LSVFHHITIADIPGEQSSRVLIMYRFCSLAAVLVACCVSLPCFAAPINLTGVGGNYTPGTTQSFQVSLPPISNLGSYNIDLLLTSDVGIAGTDFFFDLDATNAASSGYVFPSSANYLDAVNIDSASVHRLTLSDFDLTGTDVVAGVNDNLVTVVLGTASGFESNLVVSFDVAGLILDTPDVIPSPVTGFSQLLADTRSAGFYLITPIPEPHSVMLMGLGIIVAGIARQSRRDNKNLA
jgi:hypothetical protein